MQNMVERVLPMIIRRVRRENCGIACSVDIRYVRGIESLWIIRQTMNLDHDGLVFILHVLSMISFFMVFSLSFRAAE